MWRGDSRDKQRAEEAHGQSPGFYREGELPALEEELPALLPCRVAADDLWHEGGATWRLPAWANAYADIHVVLTAPVDTVVRLQPSSPNTFAHRLEVVAEKPTLLMLDPPWSRHVTIEVAQQVDSVYLALFGGGNRDEWSGEPERRETMLLEIEREVSIAFEGRRIAALSSRGRARLLSGRLDRVTFRGVDLAVGGDIPDSITSRTDLMLVAPTVTGAEGTIAVLNATEATFIAGALTDGLRVSKVQEVRGAEIDDLCVFTLSPSALPRLQDAARVSLWVGHSWRQRRRLLRQQHDSRLRIESGPRPSMAVVDPELVSATRMIDDALERRARVAVNDYWQRLLRLTAEHPQTGSVESVIREVERGTRRRALPFGRERLLLSVSRTLTGYGERILRPLAIHAGLVAATFLYLIAQNYPEGRAERLDLLYRLSLPGLTTFGLNPEEVGGFLPTICRVSAIVFIAASLNAVRKILRA